MHKTPRSIPGTLQRNPTYKVPQEEKGKMLGKKSAGKNLGEFFVLFCFVLKKKKQWAAECVPASHLDNLS